jgi:DNA-directed RNA polymerase specialized sigma24 family protein
MAKVLRHHLATLARRELAGKRRTDLLAVSLDAPLDPAEPGVTLLDTLPSGLPGLPGAPAPAPGLALDLLDAFARLTPLQRELCILLAESVPKSDIASLIGRSRDTVYEEIRRIRFVFRDARLDDYL